MRVPDGVSVRDAVVTLSFDDWGKASVAPVTFKLDVVDLSHRVSTIDLDTLQGYTQHGTIVTNGERDKHVPVAVDPTTLTSIVLHSTEDVEIKTNSISVPDEMFVVRARKPFVWKSNKSKAPISKHLSALYVTNVSGQDARVNLNVTWDPMSYAEFPTTERDATTSSTS